MGLFGKLLSLPIDIINIPAKIVDKVIFDNDGIVSSPLDAVSDIAKNVGDAVDEAIDELKD